MKARVQFDGSMSKTFPISRGVKQGCVLAPTLFAIFCSALLAHAFPEDDKITLRTQVPAGCLTFPGCVQNQDQACTDSWTAVRRWGFLVSHSEMHLQILWNRFAKACTEFSMIINLKKTTVMSLGHPFHYAFSSMAHSLKFSVRSLIWDLFSTLRTIWTTKSINELERLRLTSGDLVLGYGKITTSQSN